MAAITVPERRSLEELESLIEESVAQSTKCFVDIGKALEKISRDRLFKEDFNSFAKYTEERWGFSRQRAYQLIEGARVFDNLSTRVGANTPLISNESQARQLAKVHPDLQAEVWCRAVKSATDEGAKSVSPRRIEAAWEQQYQEYQAQREAEEPSLREIRRDSEGERIAVLTHKFRVERRSFQFHLPKEIVSAWDKMCKRSALVMPTKNDLLVGLLLEFLKTTREANPRWDLCDAGSDWKASKTPVVDADGKVLASPPTDDDDDIDDDIDDDDDDGDDDDKKPARTADIGHLAL